MRLHLQPRHLLHSAMLATLVAGAACQAAAPPTPTIGATTAASTSGANAPATSRGSAPAATAPPTQAARATSAPAPTAAPTAVPLPTFPADKQPTLSAGQAALAAGDYARAKSVLQPLVDQVDGEAQAEAQLLLGQAQTGAGSFDDALASAKVVQTAAHHPQIVSAAHVLAGQALRGLKRWDEAAVEYRRAADANPLVASAADLELAEMWLQAGNPDQAAADATKGLADADPRLLKINLAENLAKAQVQRHDTEAAMDAYRQLLTAAGTKGYLGEQLYNLAVGANALGRTDDAIQALRTSIEQFPKSRNAPEAADLLEQLNGMRPEDHYYAGVIRYLFWQFKQARADFDAYLAAEPNGDHALEAQYYRGLSSPAKDTTTQLLALADQAPDDDIAPQALLEAGKAQEELANYSGAEQIFARLVAAYPTRDAGLAGAFREGLAMLMQNRPDDALRVWNTLVAQDLDPSLKSQTLYWSGKALASKGDDAGAKAQWTAAAAVRPVDYYVMRAQVALNPPPATDGFDPGRIGPADEDQLAAWFKDRGLDLAQATREVEAQPGVQRAAALTLHGLYRQANWEFESFLTQYADKPAQLYALAAKFGALGLPNGELKLGTAALDAATAEGEVSVLDVPNALQRVAFPLAFPDMETPMAREQGLDPLLFESLMRQESDFDPYAESVAKAKGLTQIIPQTGTEIATALKVPGFTQESLFQPRTAVQFGSWYFGQRLKRNGQTARALAAYNAGDGNVDNWTGVGRDDPDVFAEYVPFDETNDYVKKILTYWWTARYVWGS